MRLSLLRASSVLAGLLLPAAVLAQAPRYTVRGVVLDGTTNEPLVGATVRVEGTLLGASADVDGRYAIAGIPAGTYRLTFSFIGYSTQTQSVTLGAQPTVEVPTVTLQEDLVQADEVIVTGSGAPVSRRELGNTVSTVSARDIALTGSTSVDGALSGKLAGAQVTQNSGNPAGGISVRLRGTSTVLGSADPLYIIDGVIVSNDSPELVDLGGYAQNRLSDINPADIERIEVIKGAAAAAIYGSRANNGVVQIFTRQGRQGAPVITLGTSVRSSAIRKTLGVNMYPYDRPQSDPAAVPVTRYDFQDFIFRTALGTENFANISGGTQNTQYYGSGSYLVNEGIVGGSNYQRATGRLRLNQVVAPWLNVGAGLAYTNSRADEVPNGGLNEVYGALTGFIFSPNTVDPRRDPVTGDFPTTSPTGIVVRTNPVEAIELFQFRQNTDRFTGDVRFNLLPLRGLGLDYTLGLDTYTQSATALIPLGTTSPYANGYSRSAQANVLLINHDLTARYATNVGANLRSTTVLGGTMQFDRRRRLAASSTGLSPLVETVNAGASQVLGEFRSEQVIYGAYAQQTLGWRNRLFLTGAYRVDASSSFGVDERWQSYPKLGVSYVVSEEDFWKNGLGSAVPSFKLRASYGQAGGLTAIGPYDRLQLFTSTPYLGRPGLSPQSQRGNPSIKPERQTEIEVGFEAGLLRDRLGVEFSWYDKTVDDLLLFRTLAPSSGYATGLQNVGQMTNRGIELLVRAAPVQTRDFGWATSLTYSRNRNEVTGIEGGRLLLPNSFGQSVALNGFPIGVFFTTFQATDAQGNPILTKNATATAAAGLPQRARGFYGTDAALAAIGGAWVFPERANDCRASRIDHQEWCQAVFASGANAGQPLTGAGTALLSTVTGDPNPDWTGSWTNEFTYRNNLSLRVQFDAQIGGDVFNFTRRVGTSPNYGNLDTYQKELEGTLPKGYGAAAFAVLGNFVEDGSFVKLRELALSYTFYPRLWSIRSLRASVVGRNLLSFDSYSGYDPEINTAGQSTGVRGFDFVEVPIPRTFSLGVTATF